MFAKRKLVVLDDHEGQIIKIQSLKKIRKITDVSVLNHTVTKEYYNILKECNILFAMKE